MYLLYFMIALSILTVCTGLENLLPLDLAPIARLGNINVHNSHKNSLLAIHTGRMKRDVISSDGGLLWGDEVDVVVTKKKHDSSKIDPELAKAYANHKEGDGLLAANPLYKKRDSSKKDANHRKGEGLTGLHRGAKYEIDPALKKKYANHAKGEGLLAIYDGTLGSHIEPLLAEFKRHLKDGRGVLMVKNHKRHRHGQGRG